MYWRPWTQTVSFLPFGGVGALSEADSRRPLESELGGLTMLGSLMKVTTVSTTRISAAADGPADLQSRVAVDLCRDGVLLGPELEHRVDQRALDDHGHDGGDVQDDLVQRLDLVRVRRAARLGRDEVGHRGRREDQGGDDRSASIGTPCGARRQRCVLAAPAE